MSKHPPHVRDRALQFRFNKFAHYEWTTDRIIAFVRDELERAARIADDCRCDRSTKCSCADHAAIIRKLKE